MFLPRTTNSQSKKSEHVRLSNTTAETGYRRRTNLKILTNLTILIHAKMKYYFLALVRRNIKINTKCHILNYPFICKFAPYFKDVIQ